VRSAITHINDIGGILALGSSTSSIRLYSPVDLYYTTIPTTGQLGSVLTYYVSGLPLNTTGNGFLTFSITTNGLPIGSYIGIVRLHINPSYETRKIQLSTTAPQNGLIVYGYNDVVYNAAGTLGDGIDTNLTFMLFVTNATTSLISFQIYSAYAASTLTYGEFRVMRIG
jgi:hypothetical protein